MAENKITMGCPHCGADRVILHARVPAVKHLEGLQNLCDALADYAHDVLGKDCLCVTKEDEDG
jgi:hypothetical protein